MSRSLQRLALAVPIALGAYFLFSHLTAIGLTYDELTDLNIARNLLASWDFFADVTDPTQGRLSHMVAAAGMSILGVNIFGLKLPFALIGLATAVVFGRLVARRFGERTGWLSAGLLLLCPFSLSAFRTAATAGDGLVLTLWLLLVWSAARWADRGGTAPALQVGLLLGLAVGAKLTAVVLVVLPLIRIAYIDRDPRSWMALAKQLLVVYAAAIVTAVLANPLFLLGPNFLSEVYHESLFDNVPEILVFGEWLPRHPLTYVPALLVAKVTVPLLLAAFGGLGLAASDAMRDRRPVPLALASLVVGAAALLHAIRQNQNAHYYIGIVGPCLTLGAVFWHRLFESSRPAARWAGVSLAVVTVVFLAFTASRLTPDFLQAGREFGPAWQGEFNGPAVNHCQGGPLLIADLERQRVPGDVPLFVLAECREILEASCQFGGQGCQIAWKDYPKTPPEGQHYVVVPRIYLYSRVPRAEWDVRRSTLESLTKTCEHVPLSSDVFTAYRCAGARRPGAE